MSILEFKNAFYTHGDDDIINDLSIKIDKGDFIYIVGPSGGGKSTFLKLCCHLISLTKGKILYKGIDMNQYDPIDLRLDISYCFQTPYLFGDTVEDNFLFPYKVRNKKVDLNKIYELLEQFKFNRDFFKKEVKNLSGGEKQRIALIRNLLFKPEILLLDEVTSALDAENTLIVEDAIKDLNEDGVTILWVTHDIEQSKRHGNKILTLENGKIKSLEVIQSE
ncbi:MAG: ATP-binding cassette domain-containing protein [Tissierellia bacterium]|nr:ATP-binding cassette domain-containing protein [Tissierellia bacterium]